MRREGRPGGGSTETETAYQPATATGQSSQISSIGPDPGIAEMFLGALLYSSTVEAGAVLLLVQDSDVDHPWTGVLAAIRSLVVRDAPPSPVLVADELRRTGSYSRRVAVALTAATTTGACASAARHYAGAVLAETLRKRVESCGAALRFAAETAPEVDLLPLTLRAAEQVRDVAQRLAQLRGALP